MTAPRCLVVGAGRLALGHLAPLLADAGWQVLAVTRTPEVAQAVDHHRGVTLSVSPPADRAGAPIRRFVPGLRACTWDCDDVAAWAQRADLVVVSVGPDALPAVGNRLGPLLLARVRHGGPRLSVLVVENHRRAPELLARGLLGSAPGVAPGLGDGLAIAGGVSWRIVSQREVQPSGVVLHTDGVDEVYVDVTALSADDPPLDGSVPGLRAVAPFDAWMTEKLWTFNAGHAAAAYLGRLAGHQYVDDALSCPDLRRLVRQVVHEAQTGLAALFPAMPLRSVDTLVERYASTALHDPVTRVARDPRRKLGSGDRLVGPALACQSSGREPRALAFAIAAALHYRDGADEQSVVLHDELRLLGPAEVLSMTSDLGPEDELTRLVAATYADLLGAGARS